MTGSPFLKPHQMCNPAVYVVDDDMRGFSGELVKRHAAELRRWADRDDLSPTACGILAFLSFFRGLRGNGRDGCGVQLSLEAWARVLGRSRRMVQYAFDELQARGYIFRRRRFVKLKDPWTDERGRTHTEADIRYAVYLTELGARRIERRGETRALKVVVGKGLTRVLQVVGVVGFLFKELGAISKALASRVTDAVERCTPSSDAKPNGAADAANRLEEERRGDHIRSSDHEVVENVRKRRALEETKEQKVDRLLRNGQTTAALLHADEWPTASIDRKLFLVGLFNQEWRGAIAARIDELAAERRERECEIYEREAF